MTAEQDHGDPINADPYSMFDLRCPCRFLHVLHKIKTVDVRPIYPCAYGLLEQSAFAADHIVKEVF